MSGHREAGWFTCKMQIPLGKRVIDAKKGKCCDIADVGFRVAFLVRLFLAG